MIPTTVEVEQTYIKASEWVKRGNMIVKRSALDFDDPDSYWCLWYTKFKEILPEEFQEQLYGDSVDPVFEEEILDKLEKIKHRPIYIR